ncbi:hypothetical protein CLV78_11288 [Aliiruegeria haliotis]|uniref:Beta-barrel assembly machine subunit BamE n=1 Tax=Aliiruegeria haliotis TaxID=1280846 RepID=A0A2T0RHR8_9RHOB|nr:hypothetical protein CLV78_11288 [Aliiruegeria haliotis]
MRFLRQLFEQPVLVAGCLVLAACSTGAPDISPGSGQGNAAPGATPVFTNQGIDVGTTGLEIDFGRTEPGAIKALSKLIGRAPATVAPACSGLRAARWADGTTMYFEERRYDPAAFVGWSTSDGSAGRTCGT